MRILISSLQVSLSGSKGHLHPALELGIEAKKRGHEVFLLPLPAHLGANDEKQVARCGISYIQPPTLPSDIIKTPAQLASLVRDTNNAHKAYQSFLINPLNHQFPGVEAIVRELQPDIIIYDLLVYTAPLMARKFRIPDLGFCAGLKLIAPPSFQKFYKKTAEQLQSSIKKFLEEHQFQADFNHLELMSSTNQVVFSTPELVGTEIVLPRSTRLVGPIHPSKNRGDGEADDISPQKEFVVLSFGSVLDPFDYPEITENIVNLTQSLDVELVIGSRKLQSSQLPDHVTVSSYLDLKVLLPKCLFYIHHGGANSFSEAFYFGAPQMLIPLTTDQPIQAHFLKSSGAGVSIPKDEVSFQSLKRAATNLLATSHPMNLKAKEIHRSFKKHSGARNTIDLAEKIVREKK